MRLRIEVRTRARKLSWDDLLAPGRGIVYGWLADTDPGLASELHCGGIPPHGMVPFGYGPPRFPLARRERGHYTLGGPGFVEFGSPFPELVTQWTRAVCERDILEWGGIALRIEGIDVLDPPRFASGEARLRTISPVVLRELRGDDRLKTTWVMPGEPGFASALVHNLRRKAETLGLSPEVDLRAIPWFGERRSFRVKRGHKTGAPVEVVLAGPPETLRAIWSWGLGQANSAGCGWIDGDRDVGPPGCDRPVATRPSPRTSR